MRCFRVGVQTFGGIHCSVPRSSRGATGLLPAARWGRRSLSDGIGLGRSLPAELRPGARVCGQILAGHIDDPLLLPDALMLVITAGPTIQLPSVSIVSVALGVVIRAISASEKVRSAV